MSKQKLFFVSTNSRKFTTYVRELSGVDVELIHVNQELQEPQSVDVREIIAHKLTQAKSIVPGERVFVDDRGFCIPALENFPGPMLKLTLATIGIDGLLALMNGKKDRSAEFVTGIGYFDGSEDHLLKSREQGFITNEKQGSNLRGWTDLLYIYGHESFNDRSLASLSDNEWESYLNLLRQDDVSHHLAICVDQN